MFSYSWKWSCWCHICSNAYWPHCDVSPPSPSVHTLHITASCRRCCSRKVWHLQGGSVTRMHWSKSPVRRCIYCALLSCSFWCNLVLHHNKIISRLPVVSTIWWSTFIIIIIIIIVFITWISPRFWCLLLIDRLRSFLCVHCFFDSLDVGWTTLCTTSPLRMLSKWPWISRCGDYIGSKRSYALMVHAE